MGLEPLKTRHYAWTVGSGLAKVGDADDPRLEDVAADRIQRAELQRNASQTPAKARALLGLRPQRNRKSAVECGFLGKGLCGRMLRESP